MKLFFKHVISFTFIAILFFFIIIPPVHANIFLNGLTKAIKGTEYEGGKTDLPMAIGNIIQIFLGFLGIIAVILILFAGYMWMTAGGDSGKIEKAKDYIKNAIIGIVIILASYIITSFVISQISTTLKK